MKKIFYALMLSLAVVVGCSEEYDDSALVGRMEQIEKENDALDAALSSLMERIAAAEEAVASLEKAAAAQDYVTSVVASEDGKGVIVSFKTAEAIFIPLDLDASQVDGVVVAKVTVGENEAVFEYTDGTTVTLPLYKAQEFALVLDAAHLTVNAGETVKIAYSVTGATENTVVDVLATSAGYVAMVVESNIEVTVPKPFVDGSVLVWADNGDGKTSIKKVTFAENSISVEEVAEVPAEGGSVVIKGVSNVEVTAEVVEGAEWLTAAPAAKAEFSFEFTAAANEGEARTAKVALKTAAGAVLYTVEVAQASGVVKFATRVASYYSSADGAAWCSFIPGIANRTMASDGKYVYLQSSEASPKVYAVEVSSLLAGDASPVYKELSTANMSGGTHAVSALRCIPNADGAPILIATNLAIDGNENFNIYAYTSGIDADPVLFHAYRWDAVANVSDWRRYGDRISVSGTWQDGTIWVASNSGTKVMAFHIEDGATEAALREYCWFDTFAGGLAEATYYPETEEAIVTTAASAGFWTPNAAGEVHTGGSWPKWDAVSTVADLNGAFSFQFFTYNEKNYIAYVQLPDSSHCNLVVVEDLGGFAASLAGEPVFTAPLYDGEEASCPAANTYGDCSVVEIDGALHIVAMMQGGGLSIFKLN